MPTVNITLHQKTYPIKKSGNGDNAILIIGIGTLLDRTLPSGTREKFEIYSSDIYWDGLHAVACMSMDGFAKDIDLLRQALNLDKPILLAHSAYGPLAIHAAKLFPDSFAGVIMIGSPPGWNDDIVAKNQQFFAKDADEERKAVDQRQRKLFDQEKLNAMEDPYEEFLATYCDRDRARYFYNPNFDSRYLWDGLSVNMPVFNRYFDEILPVYDLTKDIDRVVCPVFLAAGRYDYDCCPTQRWGELKPQLENFTVGKFDKSGHYPNLEQPELFTKQLTRWYEDQVTPYLLQH